MINKMRSGDVANTIDPMTVHILNQIAEYESLNKVISARFVCPCLHDDQTGFCIRMENRTWQDIDYQLKMMKHTGLIQADERKDPVVGISFTCLSAEGRKMLFEAHSF